ncbi:MAG: FecR domain-containing protein [Gammaproteobacteria bacterium]|nr:FecR domain-containing protein [Gammaproteobacteria bacterium]
MTSNQFCSLNNTAKNSNHWRVVAKSFATAGVAAITLATGSLQATTSAEQARADGVWQVESGQWLGRIVARLQPDFSKRAELMELIVFNNPQAFVNADPNRMLAGASLTLPGKQDAVSVVATKKVDAVQTAEQVAVADRIGRVIGVRGQLTADSADGSSRQLRRRSYVRQGDTLTTSDAGGAQVRFNDGAQIALRKASSLRVDEYDWQGQQNGNEKAGFSLIKGGFRTITGAIGKVNKASYRVNTPFATIGIRGTHYALMSCQGGSCDGLGGADTPTDDGLYGGTAFGAISVDGEHVIEPQQYFHHDGNRFQALMGPPDFLFAADTQPGSDNGNSEPATAGGQADDNGNEQTAGGGDSFAGEGGTESDSLIAVFQQALPGQENDSLGAEGELEEIEKVIDDLVSLSGLALGGQGYDPAALDLTGDLSNVAAQLVSFYQSAGATNVVLVDSAASNGVAYTAQVFPFLGQFEASDGVVDDFAGGSFFILGSVNGQNNVLLGGLEIDGSDIGFFSGPPAGAVLDNQTVIETGFSAQLGRWDQNVISRFFEPSDGDTVTGVDLPLATAFVHSLDRTPDIQLASLTGGTHIFTSIAGFGSDELGGGFQLSPGDIQFFANLSSQEIRGGSMNLTDSQGRFWSFSASGLSVALENDASIDFTGAANGFCSGCASGSSAEAFLFMTFLGNNAEGALGSFGAQTGTLAVDADEAIGGVYVATGAPGP